MADRHCKDDDVRRKSLPRPDGENAPLASQQQLFAGPQLPTAAQYLTFVAAAAVADAEFVAPKPYGAPKCPSVLDISCARSLI